MPNIPVFGEISQLSHYIGISDGMRAGYTLGIDSNSGLIATICVQRFR